MSGESHSEKINLKIYFVGFFLSLFLTLFSFFLAFNKPYSFWFATIVFFALIQALIQLVCFLHLGSENKPRIHLIVFLLMLSVLLVIVAGSIFIMLSLNYRLMG